MEETKQVIKRSGKKYPTQYSIKDAYKRYVNTVGKEKAVSYTFYTKLHESAFRILNKYVIEQSETVRLPCKLGQVGVRKFKINFSSKRLARNHALSNKYGKLILHLNEHRDNHIYKYKWFNVGPVKNKGWFMFIPSRTNKRKIAYILKNRFDIDYFVN